jgi:hypothetical protein
MKSSGIKLPPVVKAIVPAPTEMLREAIIVLAGVLIASYVLSRFPGLKKYVSDASITVNDKQGNNLF